MWLSGANAERARQVVHGTVSLIFPKILQRFSLTCPSMTRWQLRAGKAGVSRAADASDGQALLEQVLPDIMVRS